MKKILSALFILIIYTSVFFSQQVFKSDEHKFQITFPDDCRLYPDYSGAAVIAYFDKNASINIIVKESKKLKNTGPEQYDYANQVDSMIKLYGSTFKNFKLNDTGYVSLSDIKFFRLSYQCDLLDKVFWASQYFTVKDSKMYVLSTGCFESDIEKYRQVFIDCVSTFTFIE
ncbi:MAG: hypothetical protein EHM58_09440 [Ignavibacteriae bacterium]|nr:MAG: hypothetical protein EHM58_09440 [Ignavibacteriota bacterium]